MLGAFSSSPPPPPANLMHDSFQSRLSRWDWWPHTDTHQSPACLSSAHSFLRLSRDTHGKTENEFNSANVGQSFQRCWRYGGGGEMQSLVWNNELIQPGVAETWWEDWLLQVLTCVDRLSHMSRCQTRSCDKMWVSLADGRCNLWSVSLRWGRCGWRGRGWGGQIGRQSCREGGRKGGAQQSRAHATHGQAVADS